MFQARENGYREFQNQLMNRVVLSLVEDEIDPNLLEQGDLEEYIGLDLSEFYWSRIPREHYHFLGTVADTPSFYAANDVDFKQPTADLIEQIAFTVVVTDTLEQFTITQDDHSRLIETVRMVLATHNQLDELLAVERFETPSEAVDDFFTWVNSRDETIGLAQFNEAHIRRNEALNAFSTDALHVVSDWCTDRLSSV